MDPSDKDPSCWRHATPEAACCVCQVHAHFAAGTEPPSDLIDQLLVELRAPPPVDKITEDRLMAHVDPKTMTEGVDASRAFWRLSEEGMPWQTVIHTNPAATHDYIKRYLQHCNPRPVTAALLSHDDACAEWARISAGTPTYPGSTCFVVE
jgi:hypothetical protein